MLRRLLFLAAGCSMLALGCSSSSDGSASSKAHTPSDSTSGNPDEGNVSIRLGDGDGPLTFSAGLSLTVPVQVDPPAVYTVRFSLVGDARDAFLDRAEATTDPDGKTSVVLTAPSSQVVFRLRATVPGASAELPVSAANTLTTLDVTPVYDGQRPVTTWVASVDTGSNCDPLAWVQADGPLTAEAPAGHTVSIGSVPVGTALRLTVRAAEFAGGCVELPASAVGERRSVSVTVTDRPLQMNGVKMPVTLGIDATEPWKTEWSALAQSMVSRALDGKASDASALLDAMLAATPYLSQDEFVLARTLHGWDARVGTVLDEGPGTTAIRDALTRWIGEALPTLTKQAFTGTLTSPSTMTGTASLNVTAVGGAAPSDVGFPSTVGLTWTAATGDQVLFGATASWVPSHLAAALCEMAATKEVSSATSVSDALSKTISCTDIGAALARDTSDVPFLSCDASCLAERCTKALDAMWNKARAAAPNHASLHVAASGLATIDDSAHPSAFKGSWVGDASLGQAPIHLTGAATGGRDTPSAAPR